MNRLHQLKNTLITNILENSDYSNLEFILLDYNSSDGLSGWVNTNLMEYIKSGKLVYFKTFEPAVFNHSHSKNLAFRLASGDIVCNINADHHTGAGFAKYINDEYNNNPNAVLTTIDLLHSDPLYRPPKDVFGKVCVRKSDFLRVGGFDESMVGYGFEDWDLISRLHMYGIQIKLIKDRPFLNFITHGENERYKPDKNSVSAILICHVTPALTKIIYLFSDSLVKTGILVDTQKRSADKIISAYTNIKQLFEFDVLGETWDIGFWRKHLSGLEILLENKSQKIILGQNSDNSQTYVDQLSGDQFCLVKDEKIVADLSNFEYLFRNRQIMQKNKTTGRIVVNDYCFGTAVVYKNEDLLNPHQIS